MMKYLFVIMLFLILIDADCQTTKAKDNSCASLISKGYTQLFCDYDKKNGFKDIPFGIKVEELNKKIPLMVFPDYKTYTPNEEHDKLKYQNWNNTVFYHILFKFNKNKQLYNVQLSIEEDTTGNIFWANYDAIYNDIEKKFGKAELYQLKDSSKINTIGNIYGWDGKNIEIILKKGWNGNIIVNIYSKKFEIDKEIDDL